MKQVIAIIAAFLFVNSSYTQNIKLQGVWTQCLSYDSTVAFQCNKGWVTYDIDSAGNFILEDSVFCHPRKYAQTGKWKISGNKLVISHDSNSCITRYPSISIYYIIWVNNDLFYYTHISQIENPGEKSFTVFRKLK